MTEDQTRKTLSHLRDATNLAEAGSYRCHRCKAVKPLEDGLVVSWGGQVFFAVCPTCIPGYPIMIEETTLRNGKPGFRVGPPKGGQTPLIEIARGDHEVRTFIASQGLAKREKRELG
jgi:hypothetical protein